MTDPFAEQLLNYMPTLRKQVERRAGRLLLSRENISDLVQSTCRELWVRRERLRDDDPESFRRWAHTMTERKLADKGRFHSAEKRDAARTQAEAETPSEAPEPLEIVALREFAEHLDGALQRLSEADREVIINLRILEQPAAQMAAEVGEKEATLRVRLHRAMARLAVQLGVDTKPAAKPDAGEPPRF